MHRKRTKRWAKLLVAAALLAAGLWFAVGQVVSAAPKNPEPVCAADTCTVTFEYRGEPYLWSPPSNAINLRFELYGAQGGQGARSIGLGGFGGRVAGEFIELPANLQVWVGGAGVRAGDGGFNGGGAAGSGHGDEGSGGGATDLRIGSSLEDRVVIAGGGGGAGGLNWGEAGLGGAGGGLVGGIGGWGQAGPGFGGGSLSGGAAGQTYGGTKGTAGDFGIGGKGGSSRFAGGGGGGGGYFGGGGGGADIDSGGLNGGGGGGGSGFANSSKTRNVLHESGVRSGAGLAILTYDLVQPKATPSSTPSAGVSMDVSADASSDVSIDASTDVSTDVVIDITIGAIKPTAEPSPPGPSPVVEPARPSQPAQPDQPSLPAPEVRTVVDPVPAIEPSPETSPSPTTSLTPEVSSTPEATPTPEARPAPVEVGALSLAFPPDRKIELHTQPETRRESLFRLPVADQPPPQRGPAERTFEPADLLPQVYFMSGLSLTIGLGQAVRRLRQNRRALARRFVRIS